MKRMASAKKTSGAEGTSTKRKVRATRFAVCVRDEEYEASLECNTIYVVLPDDDAEHDGDLRVIDESGKDYLFSADRFVAIDLPAVAFRLFQFRIPVS
jgi:hypothetical protein